MTPAGSGHTINLTKPADNHTVTPAAAVEQEPKRSFDVDVYEPKTGDTYATISQEFYNDARYAAALQAYNRNKPIQGGGFVDVPPLHALKRTQPGQPTGRGSGTGSGSSTASPWSSPASTSTGPKTYRVPVDMSLPTVAKAVLKDDQRWGEIYDLNKSVNPGQVPAGTILKLPADAKVP